MFFTGIPERMVLGQWLRDSVGLMKEWSNDICCEIWYS